MRNILCRMLTPLILAFCLIPQLANAEPMWWNYLAEYDEGPGSTRIDLSFKYTAPLPDYRYVIITGISYPSSKTDRFPSEHELDILAGIESKVIKALEKSNAAIHVGTFTHNKEQLYYFYAKDIKNTQKTLTTLYAVIAKDRKPYSNFREDTAWQAYLEFLYPNKETIAFYKDQLDALGYKP